MFLVWYPLLLFLFVDVPFYASEQRPLIRNASDRDKKIAYAKNVGHNKLPPLSTMSRENLCEEATQLLHSDLLPIVISYLIGFNNGVVTGQKLSIPKASLISDDSGLTLAGFLGTSPVLVTSTIPGYHHILSYDDHGEKGVRIRCIKKRLHFLADIHFKALDHNYLEVHHGHYGHNTSLLAAATGEPCVTWSRNYPDFAILGINPSAKSLLITENDSDGPLMCTLLQKKDGAREASLVMPPLEASDYHQFSNSIDHTAHCAISPHGKIVAIGNSSGSVHIFDQSFTHRDTIPSSPRYLTPLCFPTSKTALCVDKGSGRFGSLLLAASLQAQTLYHTNRLFPQPPVNIATSVNRQAWCVAALFADHFTLITHASEAPHKFSITEPFYPRIGHKNITVRINEDGTVVAVLLYGMELHRIRFSPTPSKITSLEDALRVELLGHRLPCTLEEEIAPPPQENSCCAIL